MTDSDPKLKIVVGLGNPGPKYDRTRHNIGFAVLDELVKRLSAPPPNAKFEGELTSTLVGHTKLLLVRPLTFMNLSGRCVAAVVRFYKIDAEQDLIVVCDDLSLPLGKIRIRPKGSAGGQKGLSDILRAIGTQSIARLRIGIDQPPARWDAADYVLGRLTNDEQEVVGHAVGTACDVIIDWCTHDLEHCMNHFN